MTQAITQTMEDLLRSSTMERITDRSQPVDDIVEAVKAEWAYDLASRRPAPAYAASGIVHASSIDLASIMSALADRNAVINLPEYQSRRAATKKEGEWVTSKDNRHGKLVGLTANREAFSFSVRIYDQNVVNIKNNETGAYRNFMLTDLDGKMYGGWSTIEFVPTVGESGVIRNKGLAIRNVIPVKHFVVPQLRSSVFGSNYAKLKALETRMGDEASFYRTTASQLEKDVGAMARRGYSASIVLSKGQSVEVGASIPIKVEAFKAEMDIPLHGEYASVPHSRAGYKMAKARAKEITYGIQPRLRFSSRSAELAFAKFGGDGKLNPGWEHPEIERGYKTGPRTRTEWSRMDFGRGYALRWRTYQKTERVNPDSL